MGVGIEPFKTQGKVYTRTFDKDFFTTYNQTLEILGNLGATFYRGSRREGFIIMTNFNTVFVQCNDSTEVAVFFTEVEKGKTRVEVSSLNYSLSEFVARELFKGLEGKDYRKVTKEDLEREKKEEFQ